jgi:hypothetical protein
MSFARNGSVIVEVKTEIEVEIDICVLPACTKLDVERDDPESRRSRHKTAPAMLRNHAFPPEAKSSFGMLVSVKAFLLRRRTRDRNRQVSPNVCLVRCSWEWCIGARFRFIDNLLSRVRSAPCNPQLLASFGEERV